MTVNILHVGVCFDNKIITVNIITDKIGCVGYPATIIFWGLAIVKVDTSEIGLTGHLVNYHLF